MIEDGELTDEQARRILESAVSQAYNKAKQKADQLSAERKKREEGKKSRQSISDVSLASFTRHGLPEEELRRREQAAAEKVEKKTPPRRRRTSHNQQIT